jgi:hypothetical protein
MNSQLTEEIEICQAQAERQYRRAIEEFERLKALREELRNEPNSPRRSRSRPDPRTGLPC